MQSIHITTMRKMLQSSDPVDLKVWKQNGEIMEMNNVVPLRYNFYQGTRQVKILASNQIRQIRDVCIFEINGMEVFL